MLILLAGIFGVVALPFLILMAPLLLWFAVPTAVFFGVGYALRAINHMGGHHWTTPSSSHP
jgi:hypothetical protein